MRREYRRPVIEHTDLDEGARLHSSVLVGGSGVSVDPEHARSELWRPERIPLDEPAHVHIADGPTPREVEPGAVGGIWARSGDIWDREDSFYFQHRECGPADLDRSYVFAVCGPNSHTEDWTKGGIMARETTDPGSRYFGVFRPGESDGLRVQFRVEPGRPTTVFERHIGPTWRLRHPGSAGRVYVDRKVAEGKTKREAIRARKRHISNVVYRQLVIDAQRRTG